MKTLLRTTLVVAIGSVGIGIPVAAEAACGGPCQICAAEIGAPLDGRGEPIINKGGQGAVFRECLARERAKPTGGRQR